jgi:hypothetical protein
MAVLRLDQRMDWLDLTVSEDKLLQPLPRGSFKVARLREHYRQSALAF